MNFCFFPIALAFFPLGAGPVARQLQPFFAVHHVVVVFAEEEEAVATVAASAMPRYKARQASSLEDLRREHPTLFSESPQEFYQCR